MKQQEQPMHEQPSFDVDVTTEPTLTPHVISGMDFHEAYNNGDKDGVMKLAVHRNGEADACGEVTRSIDEKLITEVALSLYPNMAASKVPNMSKYQLDAVLTQVMNIILDNQDCGIAPNPAPGKKSGVWDKWYKKAMARPMKSEFLKFCDMIEGDRLTVQTDHRKLQKVPARFAGMNTFPCHFHTREGDRINSYKKLMKVVSHVESTQDLCASGALPSDTCEDVKLSLYAVPAGRVFIFATSYIGEKFVLDHIKDPSGRSTVLETISLRPKVFDMHNFFSTDEADGIVLNAIRQTADTHKFKRSSTGASGYNINPTRTSENAFDTHSQLAQKLKRRCIAAVGYDEYEEGVTDGLQVLRYNKTEAYIDHLDYIEDHNKGEEHDFDTMHLGSNRMSTILLYFTDMSKNAGGETVFPLAWPTGSNHVTLPEAIDYVRKNGFVDLFDENSWQEKLVAQCHSRLVVSPARAKAVLFYSQLPDGQVDPYSQHGACPVISDESKVAANMWIWNAPRADFPGAPVNDWVKKKQQKGGHKRKVNNNELQAVFQNSGRDSRFDNAQLFFQDTFWAEFGKGSPPSRVNTYNGHEWNVKVGDQILKTFIVSSSESLHFTV